ITRNRPWRSLRRRHKRPAKAQAKTASRKSIRPSKATTSSSQSRPNTTAAMIPGLVSLFSTSTNLPNIRHVCSTSFRHECVLGPSFSPLTAPQPGSKCSPPLILSESYRLLLPLRRRAELAALGIGCRQGVEHGSVLPTGQLTRLRGVLNRFLSIPALCLGAGGPQPGQRLVGIGIVRG